MKKLRELFGIIIFVFATIGIWADPWDVQTSNPNLYAASIWNYGVQIGNADQSGNQFLIPSMSIHGIALPACSLPMGIYITGFYELPGQSSSSEFGGSPGSTQESISGPVSLSIAGGEGTTSLISPRYINACNTSAPCVYSFPVHFYIQIPKPNDIHPENDQYYAGGGITWTGEPNITIKVYSGINGNLIYRNVLVTPQPKVTETISFSNSTEAVFEFDLPAGDYAIISYVNGGTYTYNVSPPPGMEIVATSAIVPTGPMNIYYFVDNQPPNIVDKPFILEKNEPYYLNSSSISLSWNKVEDRGANTTMPVQNGGATGVAGYYIRECNSDGTLRKNSTGQIVDPLLDLPASNTVVQNNTVTGNFTLPDGEYYLIVSAYDQRGLESIYTYDQTGTTITGTQSLSPCHIFVDQVRPNAVSGLSIQGQTIPVNGKSFLPNPSNLQLAWTAGTDALSGIGGYKIKVCNITDQARIVDRIVSYSISDFTDPSHPSVTISLSQLFGTSALSGIYVASIEAVDKAGNTSDWSPTIPFYIDQVAPSPPAGSSFTVNGLLGAAGPNVNFQIPQTGSSQENITLFLAIDPNLDGIVEWQSGIGSYIVKDTAAATIATISIQPNQTTATITLPGVTGVYKVYSIDRMGNTGSSSACTVSFNLLTLGQVTFGSCTYDNASEKYQVTWQPPSGAANLQYKAIVLTMAETPPVSAFDTLPESNNTMVPFPGTARDIVYVSVLARDSSGSVSVTTQKYTLPSKNVPPGAEVLSGNTTWSGTRPMTRSVYVPAGVTLTVEAGSAIPASEDVELIVDGTLIVAGTDANPVTFSYVAGSEPFAAWKGITVSGHATIDHMEIKNALRGVSALTGSTVTITNSRFIHNQVGLHIYNDLPTVTGCRFQQCLWYGVKEDAIPTSGPRPAVRGCVFTLNGYDYYHDRLRNITMSKLNEINGNTADMDKNRKE